MARWIAVAMLGVCLSAEGTSYYVSNSGSDGNKRDLERDGVADVGEGECAKF